MALIYCRIYSKIASLRRLTNSKNSTIIEVSTTVIDRICADTEGHTSKTNAEEWPIVTKILKQENAARRRKKRKDGHLVFESPAQTRSQRILKPSTPPSISFQNLGKRPEIGRGGVVTRSLEVRLKLDPRESQIEHPTPA